MRATGNKRLNIDRFQNFFLTVNPEISDKFIKKNFRILFKNKYITIYIASIFLK